ncbi:MAG: hypothetical protein KAR40_15380 [Candidatus Sabulitectum sp.]|nr:hypothetical protein [Candidatus Sabulitectum sp.]
MGTSRIDLLLTEAGDGTGAFNIVGDYSSSAARFRVLNPTNSSRAMHLNRLLGQIQNAQGTAPAPEKYGGITALTNGIYLRVRDSNDNVLEEMTCQAPVKNNANWARYCFDIRPDTFGTGDNYVSLRWSLFKAGSPLILKPGQSLNLEVNDNLSTLLGHTFVVQGLYV